MSVENVRAFYEKVMSDEKLRAELKALGEKSKDNQDEAIADLLALAKENGFEFERDHWTEAVQASPGELSEDELQKVAAGGEGGPDSGFFCKPDKLFFSPCNDQTIY